MRHEEPSSHFWMGLLSLPSSHFWWLSKLKTSEVSWRWPIGDCLNLEGVNFNPFGRNHIAQKHKLVGAIGAFLEVGKERGITKGQQNLLHMVGVRILRSIV